MDSNLKVYLASQLRSCRRQAGLTQAELAEKVRRTDEAISNIERGKSIPSLETLVAISTALSLPLRDFFPSGAFDTNMTVNRLNKEAEVISVLRGLTDSQLDVALAQIRALGGLK